eukprot:s3887_g3.t1
MTAGDLAQGFLGNCWLVASIAAIVKQPTWIRKLFVEADLVAGRFVIQLFDMASGCWELVEVDDFVPCTLEDDWSEIPYTEQENGTRVYNYQDIYTAQGTKRLRKKWLPLFGRPNGRQVWALVLEKAMAKFVGSYAHLSGGTEPFAFMALTGFPLVYVFQRPAVDKAETAAMPNHWQWRGAQYAGRSSTGVGSEALPVPDDLLDEELWEKLLQYMARRCPVTSSITRYPAVKSALDYYRPDGLISGHAYALLEAREVQLVQEGRRLRLVALKNPHGDWRAEGGAWSCTWTGYWGHDSKLWQKYPEVARQLERAGAMVSLQPGEVSPKSPTRATQMSESCFWMPWDSFKLTFDKLCVMPKPLSGDPSIDLTTPATIPTVRRDAQTDPIGDDLCPSLSKLASLNMSSWRCQVFLLCAAAVPSPSAAVKLAPVPAVPAAKHITMEEFYQRPYCNTSNPVPPVSGYMSQDNLILDAGCRYNLFESKKAAECLSGTWILILGSSNTLLEFNNLVNFFAPDEYFIDRTGELIGVSLVVDVMIRGVSCTLEFAHVGSKKKVIHWKAMDANQPECKQLNLAEAAKLRPKCARVMGAMFEDAPAHSTDA